MAENDASLMQTSQLHTWIGIAAADKEPHGSSLSVFVPELTPAATGQIAVARETQAVRLSDMNGNALNSSVTTGNTITAYYIGGDSNRKYPPDVVKGEQVTITKFSNADTYYWESYGRDDGMRHTETHRLEITNRKNFGDPVDDAHTYSIEMDTKRGKHIRLQTSKGNDEKFAYQLMLDAANGAVVLADDAGNSFTIDSANAKVIARNSKNSFFMLNGEDVVIGAPRDLVIKAGRQMLLDSPLMTLSTQSGTGVLQIIANAISMAAKTAATITSPAIGLDGAVQVHSMLSATNIRADTYANGALKATYAKAAINVGAGTGTNPAVAPDNDMSAAQRHAASWEDVTSAMAIVVNCFSQIQTQIGVPTQHTGIAPIIAESKMDRLQGT